MNKIPFENGTLVTPAKVVIDGVEYEVIPAVYSGDTPLSKENLNKMQDNIENAIDTLKTAVLKTTFPIGATYITQNDTNPSTILGFGTWERLKGKVMVGLDENDEYFNEIGKTGGETKHTITNLEAPTHAHILHAINANENGYNAANGNDANVAMNYANGFHSIDTKGWTSVVAMGASGGGQPHNNLQPYRVVGYMWLRTA